MKVAVVGVGYVGLVAAACLADGGNNVVCVDKDKKKIDDLNSGIIPIYEPGLTDIIKHNEKAGRLRFTTDLKEGVDNSLIIVIAVGTPSGDDGAADISAVLTVAGQVAELMSDYRIILTKSTVPVGTHKKVTDVIKSKTEVSFDYVSNPEFLKEGSAVDDFLKPDRVIIGTTNPAVMELMKQLHAPFMRKGDRIIFMDPASAEMSKYAANVMLATRISFMNELSGLCDKLGADIEKVRSGIGSDSRIGNAFLFAGVGYGGSCFPKDVQALIHMGDSAGREITIAKAAQQANYAQHEKFASRVLKYFSDSGETIKLGVWGLAFKAKTDDIRESPAIWCIRRFLEAGLQVSAFDPEAGKATAELLGNKITTHTDAYDAIAGCDAMVIFTEWQEFRTPNFELIAERLKNKVIFDGRNLYDSEYVRKQGFEYHSIGRP
jgi:UDPglucose 6-dehydrogenase